MEAINKLFAPEFRNRLDSIISFGHLPKDVVAKVVDKFVLQLEAQLADRNVTIELSDEAREWLTENGYDEAMGARPMARLIQTTIKTPLADEVLFGRLKDGGAVRVVLKKAEDGEALAHKDALAFEFPAGPVTPKPEKDVTDAGGSKRKRSRAKAAPRKKDEAKKDDKGGPAVRAVSAPFLRFLLFEPDRTRHRSKGARLPQRKMRPFCVMPCTNGSDPRGWMIETSYRATKTSVPWSTWA